MTDQNSNLSIGSILNTLGPAVALLGLMGILTVWTWFRDGFPTFLTPRNLRFIGQQGVLITIIAVGQTFVIITAGIDLSVGSVMALSGVMSGVLMTEGVPGIWPGGAPVWVGIAGGIGTGTFVGFLNGFIVNFAGLHSFIVTLGMMGIARGACILITGGGPITDLPPGFSYIGNENFLGFPITIWIMAVVVLAGICLLRKHVLGRYTYAIGSNREAAELAGINVEKYKWIVFVICGTLSGLAGVLLASRLESAQPNAGEYYELQTIAAAVIGGTSLYGGVGTVWGTVIGAFIMVVLKNGLSIINVSSNWREVVVGVVIILAVYVDRLRRSGQDSD